MSNVTYLFGAGASAQALPTVNQFANRIQGFIDCISAPEFQLSGTKMFPFTSESKHKTQEEFIDRLFLMKKACDDYESIDTYAKKLFLTNSNEELTFLKSMIISFLLYEQLINKPDKRYNGFFASILNEKYNNFPDNLKILSWNYDNQFELSYLDFFQDFRFEALKSMLHIVSKYSFRNDCEKFCILKLNGTTDLYSNNGFSHREYLNTIRQFDVNLFEEILQNVYLPVYGNNYFPSLSFAWENFEKNEQNIVSKSMKATKETDVLVIIGYSFPFFNRSVDRQIIQSMANLKKIYFQDVSPNNIIERFKSIRTDILPENLIPIADVKQFFLPPEL